jgi:hypothetical protein
MVRKARILMRMRDYNARKSSRQPNTQHRPTHSHQRHYDRSRGAQTGWFNSLAANPLAVFFQRIFVGVLIVGVAIVAALLVLWLLRANIHQLHPMKQAVTLVFLDPAAGNTSDLLVVQLAAESKKVLIYSVKYQSETQLFSGYGMYPLASIYPLLKIERKSDHYIRATLSAVLGVMVDRIIPVPNMASLFSSETLEKQPQVVMTKLLRPFWFRSLPGVGILEKFQWLSYLEQLNLVWVATAQRDVFTEGFRFESKYHELNNCSVAVVNTTIVKGLARRISNVLDGSGLSVIRTAAEQLLESESVVVYDPAYPNCMPLVPYIEQSLPSHKAPYADQSAANRFRANIVVILGQDLTNSK